MHIVKLQLDIEVFEFWSTYTWFFSFYQTMWPVEAKVRQKNCNLTDYINNTIFTKSLSWPMWKSVWLSSELHNTVTAKAMFPIYFIYLYIENFPVAVSLWKYQCNIQSLPHQVSKKESKNCGFVNVFVNFKSIFNYI